MTIDLAAVALMDSGGWGGPLLVTLAAQPIMASVHTIEIVRSIREIISSLSKVDWEGMRF